VFGRLSIFRGGLTLEAAEAVCPGGIIEEGKVLDLLSNLVDKSLVVAQTTGEGQVRYHMLEPVRQYAREKLEEGREADTLARRHAAFFLEFAEAAEAQLRGEQQGKWLERLELEHGNLRTAPSWMLDSGGSELALRLSGALGEFWHIHGHLSEGRRWRGACLHSTEG
jgi:predicted ATPase